MINKPPELSFVIPVMNEDATIVVLFERIRTALDLIQITAFEVIFIDDGSTDLSWRKIEALKAEFPGQIIGIRFRRNFGKSAALNEGFKQAKADLIFTLDADLQDDPAEIPHFLQKMSEGYDIVSGWKQNRKDTLSKTLPSRVFNKVTAVISGVNLNDFNCGFKLYKKEVIKHITIYGELHRYIPVLAHELGFRIAEISVKHHERAYGLSKYGWERYSRGTLDLLTVLVTTKYLQKPNHLFGGLGILFGLTGLSVLLYLACIWIFAGQSIGSRPLLTLGVLLCFTSVQMISLGLISELINKKSRSSHSNDVSIVETLIE